MSLFFSHSFIQLAYVLDKENDPSEEILQLSSTQALKRSDFWSLGLDELEATASDHISCCLYWTKCVCVLIIWMHQF